MRHRREHPADQPRGMLDALLAACPPAEVTDRTLAELHLMMYRAIVVPVSASLAWSVLLGCLHHTSDAPWPWPADQVVREALRYRPIPWLLGRTVPHAVELGGVAFRPGDLLSASTYLMHQEPGRWTAPDEFRPERWAEPGEHGSYVPFGAGPYIRAGAAVAQTLLTESLTALTRGARLSVTGGDTRAVISEGNVPRPGTARKPGPDSGPSSPCRSVPVPAAGGLVAEDTAHRCGFRAVPGPAATPATVTAVPGARCTAPRRAGAREHRMPCPVTRNSPPPPA
ncbi:cytochrome P450 [Streptomyces achromogenes]|uniref:cytochrome P450 n=1 Tax=Streptomyces achromogenes TaxID=67255 RepID=UPI0036F8F151